MSTKVLPKSADVVRLLEKVIMDVPTEDDFFLNGYSLVEIDVEFTRIFGSSVSSNPSPLPVSVLNSAACCQSWCCWNGRVWCNLTTREA